VDGAGVAEGTYPITVAVRDAQNEVTTTSLQD